MLRPFVNPYNPVRDQLGSLILAHTDLSADHHRFIRVQQQPVFLKHPRKYQAFNLARHIFQRDKGHIVAFFCRLFLDFCQHSA